tara:strand:+ start:158 stop:334 length:177 start_codon:yes stop_codon:yes gene_type:complete
MLLDINVFLSAVTCIANLVTARIYESGISTLIGGPSVFYNYLRIKTAFTASAASSFFI